MLNQTFDWNGAHFEVRPMSGMDKELYTFVLADVADAVCKARGLNTEKLPYTLDKLIVTFTKWALVTTVTNSELPVCNLLLDNPVSYFDAWVKAVTTDQDLWRLWGAAYEGANRIDNSPLDVQTAPAIVTE